MTVGRLHVPLILLCLYFPTWAGERVVSSAPVDLTIRLDDSAAAPLGHFLDVLHDVIPYGFVRIQSGVYPEIFPPSGRLNRPMRLIAEGGTVRIGAP